MNAQSKTDVLKIYGIKWNKGDLSSGVLMIHFLYKPYQELNFKIHSNNEPRSK